MEVTGLIDVRGWALDEVASDDSGIDRVELFLDGRAADEARYGLQRPDIGDAYGARFQRSGWMGQVDLTNVPAGQHALEARARSAVSGLERSYIQTITVVNP